MISSLQRKLIISFLSLIVLLIIYLIPTNINYQETSTYIDVKKNSVYLLNNDLLVQTEVISNKDDINDKILEIIDTLTINGSKKNYINEEFTPVIPANTKVLDLELKDKLLKINFSKEFNNADIKAIESLVYSLTELEEVDSIMLFVEGVKIDKIGDKIIPNVLNRDFGINKVYDITTLNNVYKATMYYYVNINDNFNVVPVTLFTNDNVNKVEIIVEKLKSAPIYQSNLMSFWADNAKLLDYEIEENKIRLEFENALLDNFFESELLEEVKYAISETLKSTIGVSEITFVLDNKEI